MLPSEWVLGKIGLFLFGKTEIAFRFWPLLFAVAGVVGGYLFLSRISTPIAGLVAAFLLSVGPGFIYHSREFKPYALDLALTVWTFYAVVRLPQDRREEQDPLLVTILHVFPSLLSSFSSFFPLVLRTGCIRIDN